VQYGYRVDYDRDLPAEGVLEVASCGALVDRVVYRGLPSRGTLGLDGAKAPDAGANDDPAAWCVDATPPGGAPVDGGAAPADLAGSGSMLGIPGTPGARNRPCK